MTQILCHIPHASQNVPAWAREDILLSDEELADLLDFMTDLDVDKLWSFVPEEDRITFDTSRLVVDVERFSDDAAEPMAALGMGMYYTRTPGGREFRRRIRASYDRCLALYRAHHAVLENRVRRALERSGPCLLLDCHSFHDAMTYTPYPPSSFPDICIGTNGTPPPIAEKIKCVFESHGYRVKFNQPFSGALAPTRYASDPRLTPVMIELNRRIYENDFEKAQSALKEVYQTLTED